MIDDDEDDQVQIEDDHTIEYWRWTLKIFPKISPSLCHPNKVAYRAAPLVRWVTDGARTERQIDKRTYIFEIKTSLEAQRIGEIYPTANFRGKIH